MGGPSRLPYKALKLATEMFAGSTGFSGPELHGVFAEHTDQLGPYESANSPPRWVIFQSGLSFLSVPHQRSFLLELCKYDGSYWHGAPPAEDTARLRGILNSEATPGADVAGASLGQLADWSSVRKAWDAALTRVNTDPDGAITTARAILEAVCKHICDERGVSYQRGYPLPRLYKATEGALRMAPDSGNEDAIKEILEGVTKMVAGLGSLRNDLGDAHGKGKSFSGPAPRHAKLAVNGALAAAGFLIDTHTETPMQPAE